MSASIVKAGERETGGAWSLFEEEVPFGMGPMPHRHDWDEAICPETPSTVSKAHPRLPRACSSSLRRHMRRRSSKR
jgi:hypothetical protein